MKTLKALLAVPILMGVAGAQTNFPVSVSSSGVLANDDSYYSLISADGRHVAFKSEANNLVPNDNDSRDDIFIRDLLTDTTQLVSVGTNGNSAQGLNLAPDISGDGRYVVWQSNGSNLVSGDTNGTWDCFLRDMQTGVTQRISLDSSGNQVNLRSDQPRISPDGQWVVFESDASLVPADTNGIQDCYRWNRLTQALDLVSVDASGTLANADSYAVQSSDDGRYVTFFSSASNLVGGDTNGRSDVFWKDMSTGTVLRVNISNAGSEANASTTWPSISGDGQVVSFCSRASNLVPGDTSNGWDAFAYDIASLSIERLNVRPNGSQADSYVRSPTQLSADGRFVIFASLSTNLVPGDTNDAQDIFIADRLLHSIERVSYALDGSQTDSDSWVPDMTPDAQIITYTSRATNVIAGDTNGLRDIFARNLTTSTSTVFCDPANPHSGGVAAALTGTLGTGSASGLHLDVSFGPTPFQGVRQLGYFLVGNMNAHPGIAISDGLFCLVGLPGAAFGRYNVLGTTRSSIGLFDAAGNLQNFVGTGGPSGYGFDVPLDIHIAGSAPTTIMSGDTYHFQVWFRDTAAGVGHSNFTNGVSVTFP